MGSPKQGERKTRVAVVWPHLRVAMILLHLVAMFVLALPSSGRLVNRSQWEQPKQQADMKRWADTFGVEPEALDRFLWKWSQRYARTLRWVGRPFLKYSDYVGARQHWTMFSSPRRRTGRHEIEIEVDGEYRLIYRTKSDSADWNRWAFEHNRMRKLLAKLTSQPQLKAYDEFAVWVAKQVARDFPEANHCRVSLYTWALQEPGDVRNGVRPKISKARSQLYSLEKYR